MPSIIPGAILPWVSTQFLDLEGAPLAGGKVEFRVTGQATLKDTFNNSDLDPSHANTNPVILDASGRADIFIEPGGYDCTVSDANDVELYTVEGFEDIGQTFYTTIGTQLSGGAYNVTTNPYLITTENTVTVNSTGATPPFVVQAPPVADHPQPIFVQNLGTVDVDFSPDGSETVSGVSGPFTITAGTSPVFSGAWFFPDGTSNWILFSKYGF